MASNSRGGIFARAGLNREDISLKVEVSCPLSFSLSGSLLSGSVGILLLLGILRKVRPRTVFSGRSRRE